jgi:hypothetical protein
LFGSSSLMKATSNALLPVSIFLTIFLS